MDHQVGDRRRHARFRHTWLTGARATLRPGWLVVLVDLSAGGALVQGSRPLRPGARVHLQLVTDVRSTALAAHVTRCAVWSLEHDGVTYEGALKFEHPCDWLREDGEQVRDVSDDASPEHGRHAARHHGGAHAPHPVRRHK